MSSRPRPARERRGRSRGSIDSYRSSGSIRSVLSAGSIYSVASAGSILSVASAGSILSLGSAGSILSVGSAGSILSIRSAGGILCRDNEPMFPSVSRSARPSLPVTPIDAEEPGDAQVIDLRRAAGQSSAG